MELEVETGNGKFKIKETRWNWNWKWKFGNENKRDEQIKDGKVNEKSKWKNGKIMEVNGIEKSR